MHTNCNTIQAQFLMLFHLTLSVLLRMLAWETLLSHSHWMKFLKKPDRNFHFKVFKANTMNKMDHTIRKRMKNCAQKWCNCVDLCLRPLQPLKRCVVCAFCFPFHMSGFQQPRLYRTPTRHCLPVGINVWLVEINATPAMMGSQTFA